MDQPTENLSDRIFIRVHPATSRELAAAAEEDARKPSEVARIAITHYLALRRLKKQQEAAERALIGATR